MANRETRLFVELTRNTSHRFLKRLKAKSPKKLSREVNRTESSILGALYRLDEFLLNPQTRNTNVENQEPTGDWSPSQSGLLSLLVPQFKWLRPRRCLSHGDKSSGRESLSLPWDFFRKAEEGTLHKSTTISQWEHPCDNWSKPYSVGRSTIGKQQQICQFR